MNQQSVFSLLVTGIFLTVLSSCQKSTPAEPALFAKIAPETSGIDFVNKIEDRKEMSIFDYLYFYNGGGMAAGDFNNDGKTDLFFVSNEHQSKLYLNKGTMQFADVTEKAGVGGKSNWKTGVTAADVNGDGLLDLYVCAVSNYKIFKGHNELFINNGPGPDGVPTFTERSKEYGLDFQGFSTQAAFFDYDHDGDLDCYLLNHAVHTSLSYDRVSTRVLRVKESGDFLYRNDGKSFTDVSEKAGIFGAAMGYGLGISVGDINNDGWDDIYVANDFHEDDYYYINQKNGRFKESLREHFRHTSKFSMGNDLADINNDGFLDLMTVDMYPEDPAVEKASNGEDPLDIYLYKLQFGYFNQYTRNTLQLNMGGQKFSDIGAMAGVAATDWSWAPLLADFDNDGIKDLFVSNGIVRRPNDLEYLKYLSTPEALERDYRSQPLDLKDLDKMPDGRVHPYLYKGTDSLQFADKSVAWGFGETGYTNGAVYADLDNDGDLDLITNNINSPAGIFENKTNDSDGTGLTKNNFLQINLAGEGGNRFGISAKVVLKTKTGMTMQHNMPTRGFMSSVEPRLTFGLGTQTKVDSLWVLWPNGTGQILTNLKTNQSITLKQSDAKPGVLNPIRAETKPFFVEQDSTIIAYKHADNTYFDFSREPLMPFKVSTEGPKLAVGDVNNDGLDDFYVGGAKYQTGCLFVQQAGTGKFKPDTTAFVGDAVCEDVNSLFFDADGDKDLDLYVVTGGNEFFGEDKELLDRLYINDGAGHFRKDSLALPPMFTNKSSATAADVDGDGDLDLFVAGRVVSYHYGQSPPSYLLINNGKGGGGHPQFTDQTDKLAPKLKQAGMLTDAFWNDIDKDGDSDLITAGHWSPIRVFVNNGGKLTEQENTGIRQAVGFWQTLKPADIDGDGDMDFLAGNIGQNTKFRRGADGAVRLYSRDFLNSGEKLNQVVAYRYQNEWFPIATKDELGKSLPFLNKRFDNYRDFAGKPIDKIFDESELPDDSMKEVNTFESVWVENLGKGSDGTVQFRLHKLPMLAQVSAVFAFDVQDVTGDGRPDILLGGNFYSVSTYQGRYDASYGLVLRNDGGGKLSPIMPTDCGFVLNGEVRDIRQVRTGAGSLVLVSRNNARMQVFKPIL